MTDIEFNIDIQNTQNINANFTNSLNINLQKELTMGIELNSPLYIGADTNLRNQVAQNTADITELKSDVAEIGDLDNLTTTDKSSLVGAINEVNTLLPPTSQRDYIDNSKGMPTGSVSSNALILPEIQNYAHSTFDLSKFTIVGSPNITDDGIASGFSGSNYLTAGVSLPSTSEIIYRGELKLTDATINQRIISGNVFVEYNKDDKRFSCKRYDGTNLVGNRIDISTNNALDATRDFYYEITVSNSKLELKAWNENGTVYTATPDTTVVTLTNLSSVMLGRWLTSTTSPLTAGSIDLKQFSITVDGAEVFSGNKTGIDTIKPDNYTVEGSPVISADGVASGFTQDDYIKSSVKLEVGDIIEFSATLRQAVSGSSNVSICGNSSVGGAPAVGIDYTTGKLRFSILGGSPAVATDYVMPLNQKVYIKIYIESSTSKLFYYKTNYNAEWSQAYTPGTFELSANQYLWFGRGYNATFFPGEIDLNDLKITKNGNLAEQGCLKIPYTKSKSGSKIVDAVYRDRINDMAEQLGYANYYTLSDSDFTLPQVELYGIINRALPLQNGGLIGDKVAKTIGIFGGSFATKTLAYPAFDKWAEKLGIIYKSYAVGGAGFVQGTNFVTQATNADVHDIYVIWCSTNDFTHEQAIGTSADVYGTDTTCWANFKEVVRILYSKNPKAKICLLTSSPHLTSSQGNEEGRGTTTTYTNTLKEHVEAQKAMCAFYSLPCLDQYNNSEQNGFNYSLVCLSGDFHLSSYGYELLANNQIDFLQKL